MSTVSELGLPSALSSKILLGLLLIYTIMDYAKRCQEILNLDPKIRFAGVCDNTGETKFGGQREGVKNLLSPEETKKSNLQALVGGPYATHFLLRLEREDMLWQNMKRLNA